MKSSISTIWRAPATGAYKPTYRLRDVITLSPQLLNKKSANSFDLEFLLARVSAAICFADKEIRQFSSDGIPMSESSMANAPSE